MNTRKQLEIGTRVHVDGYDGVVVSNSERSFYGHCPESMVIVRMPGGVALKEIDYCVPLENPATPSA